MLKSAMDDVTVSRPEVQLTHDAMCRCGAHVAPRPGADSRRYRAPDSPMSGEEAHALRRRLFEMEQRYFAIIKHVADGVALLPPGPIHIHSGEKQIEQLRKAIRHALASYGTTESRRLLEKALEETR